MGYSKFAPMTPDILVRKGEATPSALIVPMAPAYSVSPLPSSHGPNAPERFVAAAPRENGAAELRASVEAAYRRWRAKHENDFAGRGRVFNDQARAETFSESTTDRGRVVDYAAYASQ
jgi:hypothetical protein